MIPSEDPEISSVDTNAVTDPEENATSIDLENELKLNF